MSVEDLRSTPDQDCEKAYRAYRLMAEEASDIVILHEPDGHIFYASSALERILKRTAEDIEQHRFFDLIHPDDVEESAKINAIACFTATDITFGSKRRRAASTIRNPAPCATRSAFRATSPSA
jgi:PAS domain-containing protein